MCNVLIYTWSGWKYVVHADVLLSAWEEYTTQLFEFIPCGVAFEVWRLWPLEGISTEAWNGQPSLMVLKAWPSAGTSIMPCRWFCPAPSGVWSWAWSSITAWMVWRSPGICRAWPWVMDSSRAWHACSCRAAGRSQWDDDWQIFSSLGQPSSRVYS